MATDVYGRENEKSREVVLGRQEAKFMSERACPVQIAPSLKLKTVKVS